MSVYYLYLCTTKPTTMRLATAIWLIFICAFIGWWAPVIICGGTVLYVAIALFINWIRNRNRHKLSYDEYMELIRKQNEQHNTLHSR